MGGSSAIGRGITDMESRFKVGDKVTYIPVVGKRERGVVKEVRGLDVFVVYHCAGEWNRYHDYTAANTPESRLVPGWD